MTRLLVTTIRRHTPHTEPSGFIYVVDAEKQQVLQRCEMIEPAFREVDTNPRGGMRGSRGISIRPDQIAIANASVIFRYDPRWKLLGIISNPSMAAVHDVLFQDDTLWVSSARNDLLFQYDLSGTLLRHFYLRAPSPAMRQLEWTPALLLKPDAVRAGAIEFRDPRTHDEETFDHAHVNSVCILPDGTILVSLGLVLNTSFSTLLKVKSRLVKAGVWPRLLEVNRKLRAALRMKKNPHSDLLVQPARARSAVIELCADGSHSLVLALDGATVPSHSLLPLPDETVIYLNTTAGNVVHFKPKGGEVLSNTKVTDGFLRGATRLADGRLLLGSRGEILTFDLKNFKVTQNMFLTEDNNESVYDIKILPEHYDNPPASFEDHFQQANGFRGDQLHQNNYVLRAAENVNIVEPTPPASSASAAQSPA